MELNLTKAQIKLLQEYTIKSRDEALAFIDKKFPDFNELAKQAIAYNLFYNMLEGQTGVIKEVFNPKDF